MDGDTGGTVMATSIDEREQELRQRERDLDARENRVIDEQGENMTDPDATTGTPTESGTVARKQDVWPHEIIDMFGEQWQVRIPSQQALTAVMVSSSKYVPQQVQTDVIARFLERHMSGESFANLFARMADPDDAEFDKQSLGALMNELATRAVK